MNSSSSSPMVYDMLAFEKARLAAFLDGYRRAIESAPIAPENKNARYLHMRTLMGEASGAANSSPIHYYIYPELLGAWASLTLAGGVAPPAPVAPACVYCEEAHNATNAQCNRDYKPAPGGSAFPKDADLAQLKHHTLLGLGDLQTYAKNGGDAWMAMLATYATRVRESRTFYGVYAVRHEAARGLVSNEDLYPPESIKPLGICLEIRHEAMDESRHPSRTNQPPATPPPSPGALDPLASQAYSSPAAPPAPPTPASPPPADAHPAFDMLAFEKRQAREAIAEYRQAAERSAIDAERKQSVREVCEEFEGYVSRARSTASIIAYVYPRLECRRRWLATEVNQGTSARIGNAPQPACVYCNASGNAPDAICKRDYRPMLNAEPSPNLADLAQLKHHTVLAIDDAEGAFEAHRAARAARGDASAEFQKLGHDWVRQLGACGNSVVGARTFFAIYVIRQELVYTMREAGHLLYDDAETVDNLCAPLEHSHHQTNELLHDFTHNQPPAYSTAFFMDPPAPTLAHSLNPAPRGAVDYDQPFSFNLQPDWHEYNAWIQLHAPPHKVAHLVRFLYWAYVRSGTPVPHDAGPAFHVAISIQLFQPNLSPHQYSRILAALFNLILAFAWPPGNAHSPGDLFPEFVPATERQRLRQAVLLLETAITRAPVPEPTQSNIRKKTTEYLNILSGESTSPENMWAITHQTLFAFVDYTFARFANGSGEAPAGLILP